MKLENQNLYRNLQGRLHIKPYDRVAVPRTSAYGITIIDNKILLVQAVWSTFLELPGGKVEKGEDLVTTLRREFAEETGYNVLDLCEHPFYSLESKFYSEDIDVYYDTRLYFFRINRIGDYDSRRLQMEEIIKVEWLTLTGLPKELMHPIHYEVLKIL